MSILKRFNVEQCAQLRRAIQFGYKFAISSRLIFGLIVLDHPWYYCGITWESKLQDHKKLISNQFEEQELTFQCRICEESSLKRLLFFSSRRRFFRILNHIERFLREFSKWSSHCKVIHVRGGRGPASSKKKWNNSKICLPTIVLS